MDRTEAVFLVAEKALVETTRIREFVSGLPALESSIADLQKEVERSAVDKANEAIASLRASLDACQDNIKELWADLRTLGERSQIPGPPGPEGRPGADGKDSDPDLVRSMVADAISRIEIPQPRDGKDGLQGEKGDPGPAGRDVDPELVHSMVLQAVAAIPAPKDGSPGDRGEKGDPGRDGSDADATEAIAALEKRLADRIDGITEKMLTKEMLLEHVSVPRLDDDGDLIFRMFGREYNLGRARGKDGKPGRDGLGFKDASISYDGGRDFTLTLTGEDGRVIKETITAPIPLYKGVWREGQDWLPGDITNYGGSAWICLADTKAKPGDGEDNGWRLIVKKGRDGRDAFSTARLAGFKGTEKEWLASLRGPEGKPGIQGLPGRDRS